ncbi:cubilin-like isoform X2 [Ostrea edulis]|nr:cubilin-like isoform X2 [Ostrea edulis]
MVPAHSINVSRYECSEYYTDLSGNISVYFPQGLFHATPVICKCTISLPKYYTIDFQIHSVSLRGKDILVMRDNLSEILRAAGPMTEMSHTRIMNSSYIELEFISCSQCLCNSSMNINVSWSFCGGIFEDNVTFTADIDTQSKVHIDCSFLLRSSPANKVAFRLTKYLQYTRSCAKDFLQIFDGIYREDSLLKEYCNNSEDDLTLGSTNEMILKLVSSGLHSHVSFSGKVIPSGGCGQKTFYHQGHIVNPVNTLAVSCQYAIKTNKHSRIWLIFKHLTLPERPNGFCTDYLQVTDVKSPYGTVNRYCGNEYPTDKLLVGNEALVTFYTNGNEDDVHAGFQIEFIECGGYFDGYAGEIRGLHGSTTSKSEACRWIINGSSTQNLILRSQDNFSSYCNQSVTILTETKNIELCNNTENIIQVSGRVSIEAPVHILLSNFSTLSWIACGVVQKAKDGFLSVDLVLHQDLNTSCPLVLNASNVDSYVLFLENTERNCTTDVEINDNTYTVSKSNASILQIENPVVVYFPSTCAISMGHAIRIRWEACKQTLTDDNGTFASPGYPGRYFANQSCVYTITAPTGYLIHLTFEDFDVGKSMNDKECGEDRVEIHNSDSVGSRGDIHCGKQGRDELIQFLSVGPSLTVCFISSGNQEAQFKGFKVSYQFLEDHSTPEYHDMKQGLLAYKTTLATTVAMGVCIGVLVFIVIALAGFLVRQRKRKGYHNPILPQESNASTSNMNGNLSPRTRKQCYIKKKDSNGLATPTLAKHRQSSLNDDKENKNKKDEDKNINEPEVNELYNHLHEESETPNALKKNDYAFVNLENKEYSTCGIIRENNEILGDVEYGTSKAFAETSKGTDNEGKPIEYGDTMLATNDSVCVASTRRDDSVIDNNFGDEMVTNSNTQAPKTSMSKNQTDIQGNMGSDTCNHVKYKPEPVTNRNTSDKEGSEMIVGTNSNDDVKSKKGPVQNRSSEEKTTETIVGIDSKDGVKSRKEPIVKDRDINGQKVSEEMLNTESLYSNVDEDNSEYGNWNGVAVHTKQKNSFIPDNDEIYSNTASIYSNNIREEIYSNDTSVL